MAESLFSLPPMSKERAEESLAIGFRHTAVYFGSVADMGVAWDIPD